VWSCRDGRGGGCLYNFRFWHLVVLNIQTKKRNRLAVFSPLLTVQLKLLMYSLNVYLNHIYKILNPLWVSQQLKKISRTTWKHQEFLYNVIIKCRQTPESVFYFHFFVQLQSIISRVCFLLWQIIFAIYMFRIGNPYQINNWKWVQLFLSWRLISNWK